MAKRNRIYSLRKGSVQWNEEDRLSLCGMLIKAGYAARIGRGMIPGTEGRKVHLSLPHPLMHERCFVMEPLAEVAPDVVHPVLKKTFRELLASLADR